MKELVKETGKAMNDIAGKASMPKVRRRVVTDL
jgi:hypothetical protein